MGKKRLPLQGRGAANRLHQEIRIDRKLALMRPPERSRPAAEELTFQQALYFFGGLIMMCAPAVPGDISHGALSLALVDNPVDCGVAKGT